MKKVIQLEKKDNVAVAVEDIAAGEIVQCNGVSFETLDNIPVGHKVAIFPIQQGESIVKYAVTIGLASCDIKIGEHVHSHNVEDITHRLCDEYEKYFRSMRG